MSITHRMPCAQENLQHRLVQPTEAFHRLQPRTALLRRASFTESDEVSWWPHYPNRYRNATPHCRHRATVKPSGSPNRRHLMYPLRPIDVRVALDATTQHRRRLI